MADITVLNSKFESSGKLESKVQLQPEVVSEAAVHQVVKATLAGRRQGNACTKGRALVQGGGAKPFKQKGTGRARQGSTRSSLMVGGGTAFGPTPRSYEQKVNKKMMLRAIQSVLADKLQAGKLTVVESLDFGGKTKNAFAALNGKGLLPAYVVTAGSDNDSLRAVRNIKNAKSSSVEGFSVYEAIKFENLVVEKAAMEALLQRLG